MYVANRAWSSALLLAQHLRVGIAAVFVRRGLAGMDPEAASESRRWDPAADPPDPDQHVRI